MSSVKAPPIADLMVLLPRFTFLEPEERLKLLTALASEGFATIEDLSELTQHILGLVISKSEMTMNLKQQGSVWHVLQAAIAELPPKLKRPITSASTSVTSSTTASCRWYSINRYDQLPNAQHPGHRRLWEWAFDKGWEATLASMVRQENWGPTYGFLREYIQGTFARLLKEQKVLVYADPTDVSRTCVFVVIALGLLSSSSDTGRRRSVGGEPLFGVFTRRETMGARDYRRWGFMINSKARARDGGHPGDGVFVTESDLKSKDRFMGCPLPQRASYAPTSSASSDSSNTGSWTGASLWWDGTSMTSRDGSDTKITADVRHMLQDEEHRRRLPEAYRTKEERELTLLLEGAILESLKILQYDPRLPCVQHYRQKNQILLPLFLTNEMDADLALVLSKQTDATGTISYTVKTWLPLAWAYVNARLMGPVHVQWLKRGSTPDEESEQSKRLHDAAMDLDYVSSKNAELKSKNAELKSKNAELKSKNAELQSQNAKLESENTGLKSLLAEKSAPEALVTPDDTRQPSLCIPWIRKDITAAYIKETIESNKLGIVDVVDIVPKLDHGVAFIHFKSWMNLDIRKSLSSVEPVYYPLFYTSSCYWLLHVVRPPPETLAGTPLHASTGARGASSATATSSPPTTAPSVPSPSPGKGGDSVFTDPSSTPLLGDHRASKPPVTLADCVEESSRGLLD